MVGLLELVEIRSARATDVPAIRDLLADDALGATREDMSDAGLEKYNRAFSAIQDDARNDLIVASLDDRLVGTYQVTYIPYLSRGGNERALIEAVRVASNLRGSGIGAKLMDYAITQARARGCQLMQLTTDITRADAHRFYERLGFVTTHHGMKLVL